MYTFESRVRFSEADHTELLTLPGLVNYFQDCSTFQSEDIGYGVESLKKSGQAWILSAWQIVVNRCPKSPVKSVAQVDTRICSPSFG